MAPPLFIRDVKVTAVPVQIEFDVGAIVIEGGVIGLMIMVIPLLIVLGIVAQAELEVNSQVMISPLPKLLSV